MASMWRAVLGASLVLSLGVLVGRLTGIVREAALAARFGATAEADIAVVILTFPDLLTTVLVSGSATALLVPRFRASAERDPAGASALLRAAHLRVAAGGALVAVLVWILADPIVRVIAPGFDEAQRSAAAPLLALAGAAIPFAAATAVTTAYLQARGRFALPATGTPLFNAVLIAAILGAARAAALGILAAAIVVAAIARWLPQAIGAIRLAGPAATTPRLDDGTGSLRAGWVEALGGTTAVIVLPFTARAIASLGAPGDVALVSYALRIVDLPLSAFAAVAYAAMLPLLSDLAARGDDDGMRRAVRSLVVATAVVTGPVTVALYWSAEPVARLIYGREAIDPATARAIADLAAVALLSLPAQGAMAVLVAAHAARRSLRAPFVAGLGAVAVLVVAGSAASALGGTPALMAVYVVTHWALALMVGLRLRADGVDPVGRDVPRDLAVATAAALLGFAPAALAIRLLAPDTLPWLAIGVAGGAMALALALAAPYRTIPAGVAGLRRLVGTSR